MTKLNNLNVGFVYDLRDDYLKEGFTEEHVAEFDTEWTVSSIAKTLTELGCKVQRIGNAKALLRELMAGKRWDLVFNIAEGVKGRSRESQVPAILELFDIPYTMSDPLVCAATLDKEIAKKLVRAAGLPTPASCVVKTEQDVAAVNLKYPLFAKPIAEGTGKGVDAKSKITDPAQLAAVCGNLLGLFKQPVRSRNTSPAGSLLQLFWAPALKPVFSGRSNFASSLAPPHRIIPMRSRNTVKSMSNIFRCPKIKNGRMSKPSHWPAIGRSNAVTPAGSISVSMPTAILRLWRSIRCRA
jgi:hypothetical protein